MLNIFLISFNFHRFCQSGCYFDFFIKKISEIFVKNIYIYASQFLGEKYIIEILTKNLFFNNVYFFNKYFNFKNLQYFDFFYNIFINFMYLVIFFCLVIFFLV